MRKNTVIALFFILLIVTMTFPLILSINKYIPGFFSTDEVYGTIWDSWRIRFSWNNHLSLKNTDFISYPLGLNLFSSGYASYMYLGILYFLSIFTTPVLTYNLQIICNFFLGLLITYILIRYITRSTAGALIGALSFGFSPYQFARSWQHISLTYNFLIPLSCLAIIMLSEKPYNRQAFFLCGSILLTFSLDYAISFFTAIALAIFFVYSIFFNRYIFSTRDINHNRPFSYIKRFFVIVILAVIVSFPQFLPIIKKRLMYSSASSPSAFNPYHRPFEDLFAQSSRPLSYFLPATVHPIFGKFTENFIGNELYGDSFTEHALYLGWIPLMLAFVAFRRWRRNRKLPGRENSENFYIGFYVLLAVMAWLFSQPPWWNIFGFKLYMPSFFMYKVLPMFRAYCRFGIVLMLAVAVLAGFGLKFFLERFKSRKTKVAVTALFCSLVLFEFWNWPPYKVIDLSKVPAVYYWLKEQPKEIVIAEYPLDYDSPNELYKFFQTVHERKIINGTIPGTYANKVAQEIRRLSKPKTASILKWMGVKYVVVHKDDYLKTDLMEDREDMEKIAQNPGLKFVKSFAPEECPKNDIMCVRKTGPIEVYEIVANPIEPTK